MSLDRVLAVLRHPLAAAGVVLALTLACLWPRIGTPGLWEPQEMAIADEAALRADGKYTPTPSTPNCERQPRLDEPRTLTTRLAAWGLEGTSSDGAMRFPLVLLAALGALATFGVAWRMGGARAGLIAGVVLLSFPLFVLQSRMLMSDLGTAVGATLIIYGLVAIGDGGRWAGNPREPLGPKTRVEVAWKVFFITVAKTTLSGRSPTFWRIIDLLIAVAALAAGAYLAYQSGGALLGLLPPLAAFAVAGGFALRALGAGAVGLWRKVDPRSEARPIAIDGWSTVAVTLATIATGLVAVWLAIEIFELVPKTVGTRALFGKSIVTDECWSHAVGGLWRGQDDLQRLFDSSFEQVGFGLFPWSALVPLALAALAGGMVGEDRRKAGAVLLAWSVAGWVATSVMQRKVGTAIFPAMPAAAIAIGLFIDGLWKQRAATEPAASPTRPLYHAAGWALVGLIFAAGVAVLAKDLTVFPERLSSLLVGTDAIKYPPKAEWFLFSLKTWVTIIAVALAAPAVIDLWLWRPAPGPGEHPGLLQDPELRRTVGYGLLASLVMSVVLGLFWAQAWHPALSRSLSSKHIFEIYRELRDDGDVLGIMGSMGNAPRYYADTEYETITSRDQLVTFLRRPERVFAMVPASELCSIHRTKAEGLEFFVVDDTNTRTLVLSNQLDRGHKDKNPLATAIVREAPPGIEQTPIATYDDQIELVGVKMPASVSRGSSFDVTLTYHVKAAVNGSWQTFVHFDRGALRFNGDHFAIRQRCQTSMWQAGDYIIDRFSVTAGDPGFPKDNFEVWTGFFTGSNPNWRNMPVTGAREGLKDQVNRVRIGTIRLK